MHDSENTQLCCVYVSNAVKPLGPICLLPRDLVPLHLSCPLVPLCQHPGWVSFCSPTQSHSGGLLSSILLTEDLFGQTYTVCGTGWGPGAVCWKDFMFFLHQVSHVLNVAYGVTNLYPDLFVYKTLQILDLPDTDITSYLAECSSFIDEARKQVQYTYSKSFLLFFLNCTVVWKYYPENRSWAAHLIFSFLCLK